MPHSDGAQAARHDRWGSRLVGWRWKRHHRMDVARTQRRTRKRWEWADRLVDLVGLHRVVPLHAIHRSQDTPLGRSQHRLNRERPDHVFHDLYDSHSLWIGIFH